MDILTTVVFLLDRLDTKNDVKKKLHNKQIRKIEKLIETIYQKSNTNINEDEYLELYSIHRSKVSSEKTKERKIALMEVLERLKYLLMTGEELEKSNTQTDDSFVSTLNKAYDYISSLIKDSIKEILSEPIKEYELPSLLNDMSENASLELVKAYLKSNFGKEEFCKENFLTCSRLNKALNFVLKNNDSNLEELKTQIIEKEEAREKELAIIEQVIVNYDRRAKNISLIEFQSLSSQSINRTLAELKERGSFAYPALNELYKEYQNRLRLKSFTFRSMREMKTTINGVEMTDKDYDVIEQFFSENNYPKQRAIFTYVRDAYLKGDLKSVERETLKRNVLIKFGIVEKPKEKIHK